MSGQRCDACGLVNWADAKSCKRCGGLLAPQDFRPQRTYRMSPCEVPSLGTYNGIGKRVIGWNRRDDGTATATVWFTFLFLPVFPLRRFKLLSPRREDFEPTPAVFQVLLLMFFPFRGVTSYYSFVERLPLSGREVLGTYLYAYLLLPLKLVAPLLLLRVSTKLFNYPVSREEGAESLRWIGPLWTCYAVVVLAWVLRRSRGG